MKILSFSLNDEPSPGGVVSAFTTPARADCPDYQSKDKQLRNNSDFGFHGFVFGSMGGIPPAQLRIESGRLVGRERITQVAVQA